MKIIDTRHVYHFDHLFISMNNSHHCNKWITLQQGRSFLQRVWEGFGPAPKLERWYRSFNKLGTMSGFYNSDEHYVAVVPRFRNRLILLHEVTHAEGLYDHDRRFMKRYIELLARYARCEPGHMLILNGLLGVKL